MSDVSKLGPATQAALLEIDQRAFKGIAWNPLHTLKCKTSTPMWGVCSNADCPARGGLSLQQRLLDAIAADMEAAVAAARSEVPREQFMVDVRKPDGGHTVWPTER